MRTIKDDLVDVIIRVFYENGFRSERPVDMKSILGEIIIAFHAEMQASNVDYARLVGIVEKEITYTGE